MNTAASSARSNDASSNTMTGFLPPSSRCTRFSVGATLAHDETAGLRSPMKAVALMAGCSVRSLRPSRQCVHEIDDAAGTPASVMISASTIAVRGLHSAGLCTTVQPAASARRDLPCGQHERRVPRRDDRHRPDGLAHRVVHVLGRGAARDHPPRRARDPRRNGNSRRRVRSATHESQCLTRVHALDERDFFAAGFDEVRNLVQDRAALVAGLGAPCGKRAVRGCRSGVHVLLIARHNLIDDARVDGRHIVEQLPAGTGRGPCRR